MGRIRSHCQRVGARFVWPTVLCTLVLLVCASAPALADEWAADFYAGPNFPSDEDGFDFDGEVTVGGRLGRWFSAFDPVDVGIFLDTSVVNQEVGDANLTIVPITALPLLRVGLARSQDFPGGRLQPYAGVGPSLVWSRVRDGIRDSTVDVGLDTRAGLTGMLNQYVGLFAEYRLTYFEPDYEDSFPGSRVRIDTTSLTHHVLFGVAVRVDSLSFD